MHFLAFLVAKKASVLAFVRRMDPQGLAPLGTGGIGLSGRPELGIVYVEDEDGPVTPLFTRRSRLRVFLRANPQMKSLLAMPSEAGALFRVTAGTALIVNPHSRPGLTVPPGVVDGVLDSVDGAATLFRTGGLERQPSEFAAGIGARLEPVPGVRAAYLGWVDSPPGPRRNVLIVVGGDPGDVVAAFGGEDVFSLPDGRECVVLPKPDERSNFLSDCDPVYLVRPR